MLIQHINRHISHFLLISLIILFSSQSHNSPLFLIKQLFIYFTLKFIIIFQKQRIQLNKSFRQKFNSFYFMYSRDIFPFVYFILMQKSVSSDEIFQKIDFFSNIIHDIGIFSHFVIVFLLNIRRENIFSLILMLFFY